MMIVDDRPTSHSQTFDGVNTFGQVPFNSNFGANMASYHRPDMALRPPRGTSNSEYLSGPGAFASRPPNYSSGGYTEFYPSNTFDNNHKWGNSYDRHRQGSVPQPATISGNGGYAAVNGNYAPNNYGPTGYVSNGYASNGNHAINMGAPIMQPVAINAYHASGAHRPPPWNQPQTHQPQYVAEPEEEKPNGGVSAKLDYDSKQMANFVIEMSAGLYELGTSGIRACDIDIFRTIRAGQPPDWKYHEFVLDTLKATRLPTNTILLGLSYFAHRLRKLSSFGLSCSGTPIRTTLTVALIMASKYLDDNTFQNKSWVEVTRIPVKEINQVERDWFFDFGYHLHADADIDNGFAQCGELWMDFKHRMAGQTPLLGLAPLNTNLPKQSSMKSMPSFGSMSSYGYHDKRFGGSPGMSSHYPTPPYSYPTPTYSPYAGTWFGYPPPMRDSPPTAPHSGPNTPQYYTDKYGTWTAYDQRYGRHSAFNCGLGPYSPMSQAYQPGWEAPGYPSPASSMYNCTGSNYNDFYPPQFTTPGFGPVGTH